MADERLEETTLRKLEGTQILVGQNVYRFLQLYSEKVVMEILERHADFIAERETDGLICMVKLRLQLNPVDAFSPQHAAHSVKWAKTKMAEELRALELTAKLSTTPNLLDHATLTQDFTYEYPRGYINVIAMTKMPGMPAVEYKDLSEGECSFIKAKLVEILESMRLLHWNMGIGFSELIVYDRETQAVSMTGLINGTERNPEKSVPVTADSAVAHQFGQDIWWQ